MIKNSAGKRRCFLVLALRNGTHGAGTSAGAAVKAGTGIDDVVVVTLRNRTHGAPIYAGTAADASVTDNIGHDMYTSIKMVLPILTHFLKNAMLNLRMGRKISSNFPTWPPQFQRGGSPGDYVAKL